MAKKNTTLLPNPLDKEVMRLVQQLHNADVRLRELLGDQVDAVLNASGGTFLLRRAQEKLIQNEAMLSAAQRIARFGSWELDLTNLENINANPLRWSDEVFRIFGCEPGQLEVSNENFFRSVHPDDRENIAATVQEAIREGKRYEFDHRIVWPDGTVRHVHEEAEIFKDPQSGRPLKMVGVVQDITERKESERELRLSEKRFSSAFENASIGMALVLPDGRWLKVNQALCRIFGYTGEEMCGLTYQGITHPDDLQFSGEMARQLFDDAIQYCEMEERFVHKQGHYIWTQINASLVRDDEHRPLYFVSQIQDITERKERERELRLSEERFSNAFENAPIGMALVLPDGHWLKVNRALCRIVGYTEQDLYGMTFQEITHPDDLAADLELVRRMLADEIQYYEMEKRYVHKRGHQVWIHLSVSLVRDDEQGPLYFVSQIQDITERTTTENKLTEQAALIDQVTDAILVRDLEHTILFWSRGAERLYGWTAEEALGRKTTDLIYRGAEKYSEAMQPLMTQGEWKGELESVTKSGKPIVMECRWTLLRDKAGDPKSVLCINTDITERKSIETHYLRAQRLESIGTLASGIAHDLNNLLAPILMGVDLLRHFGVAAGPCEEVVAGIERSAKRGSNLVKQVLSFARGVEGSRVAVHLNDVIGELASIVINTFPKNITLETKAADDLWLISGDPTHLNQVLLNLCLNARDAMPEGGRLSVVAQNTFIEAMDALTQPEAAAGRYVLIEVSDTGCGIPPENIEKIFDPFYTTKALGTGTGLGLPTVLGIVRSHGGFVNVSSEPAKGSTFKIYLPAQVEPAQVTGEGRDDKDCPRGNGESILLVDDEASVLAVTRQMLEAFGYHVLTAEHGAQAVGIFALNRDKIAVVITDMMMPVMDGAATIAALRQVDPNVRIIAASGLGSNSETAKAGLTGVKHFLAKPYTTSTLLITLRKILSEEVWCRSGALVLS